jgi:hypothetical protein
MASGPTQPVDEWERVSPSEDEWERVSPAPSKKTEPGFLRAAWDEVKKTKMPFSYDPEEDQSSRDLLRTNPKEWAKDAVQKIPGVQALAGLSDLAGRAYRHEGIPIPSASNVGTIAGKMASSILGAPPMLPNMEVPTADLQNRLNAVREASLKRTPAWRNIPKFTTPTPPDAAVPADAPTLPSGRVVGSLKRALDMEPPPARGNAERVPEWKRAGVGETSAEPQEFAPIQAPLPSGRTVGGIQNQVEREPAAATSPKPTAESTGPMRPSALGRHDSVDAHEQNALNKLNNLADFLQKNNMDASHLAKMTQEEANLVAQKAWEHGREVGNPVPKNPYKGLIIGSDTYSKLMAKLGGGNVPEGSAAQKMGKAIAQTMQGKQ